MMTGDIVMIIITALISFGLGMCVVLFCTNLKKMKDEEETDD